MDALCACKILQALFKADDVQHTVVPVSGRAELLAAFTSHAEQVGHLHKENWKTSLLLGVAGSEGVFSLVFRLCVSVQVRCVVLINCGGGINLVELLQPEEHISFYVVDRSVEMGGGMWVLCGFAREITSV